MRRSEVARAGTDLIIMCPLAEELEAVRSALDAAGASLRDAGNCHWEAEVPGGRDGVVRVIVHGPLSGMGRVKAALAAARLLTERRPKQLWLVGIAGGVGKSVRLGHLVIAEITVDVALHKVHARKTERRPRPYPSSNRLIPLAKAEAGRRRDVHFGSVASSDAVVARRGHPEKELGPTYRLLAVEMEAGGVAEAVHDGDRKVEFLNIRGISDLADPAKNEKRTARYRSKAANAAARFAVSLIPRAFGGEPSENASRARRKKVIAKAATPSVRRAAPAAPPQPELSIEADDTEVPWIRTPGGLPALCVLEMPDPCVGRDATTISFDLSLRSLDDLSGVFARARRDLGVDRSGAFTIHQQNAAWFGLGTDRLLAAMGAAEQRYASLEPGSIHHSEQVGYFAHFRDGWFFLEVQYNARYGRLHHAYVHLGLAGVPLDQRPYLEFGSATGGQRSAFFGVSAGGSKVARVRPKAARQRIRPRGRLLSVEDEVGTRWVRGLVIENPLAQGLPHDEEHFVMWPSQSLVLCDLLHHHPVDQPPPDGYHLHSIEVISRWSMPIVRLSCSW